MTDFISLCHRVGQRVPEWVQGAGGNVSEKFDREGRKILRIKASGYRLEAVTQECGYVDLDLCQMQQEFAELKSGSAGEERYAQLLANHVIARPMTKDRASMETSFHIAIGARLVVHFHSLAAIMLADRYFRGDPTALSIFGSRADLSFVDFTKPGLDLALAVQRAKPAKVYILRNHGVILAHDELSGLDEWVAIESEIKSAFKWEDLSREISDENTAQPFKVYIPDTAVFLENFASALIPDVRHKDFFYLKTQDSGLNEIWQATRKMYRLCPDLTEIPQEYWSQIAGLPTEKFRILRHLEN
jgi:rhamnose utilization protein RhaD (predicted bifunctional aldolase and dehydrogenase)